MKMLQVTDDQLRLLNSALDKYMAQVEEELSALKVEYGDCLDMRRSLLAALGLMQGEKS